MRYFQYFFQRPLLGLIACAWAKAFGTVRQKERYNVLHRQTYAYGLFRAADIAKHYGKHSVTVCEFGVASGAGLLNMINLANKISTETKVDFRIVGFDSGEGLPELKGYKDHPEIWAAGDYPMPNRDELVEKIGDSAELMFGDIADTVSWFIATLDSKCPLGFISIDVDLYTSTKSVLRCLEARPELYNPAVSIYCDEVSFYVSNKWCGELAAIREFNAENNLRRIDTDRSLPGSRLFRDSFWYKNMFVCHILDHEARNKQLPYGRLRLP